MLYQYFIFYLFRYQAVLVEEGT